MRVYNEIRQRSPEWFALRRGIPTTSNFNRIILPNGKRSGQAKKYMHQLAYERLMNVNWEGNDLSNIAAVQRGISLEAKAVEVFQYRTGLETYPVGFITNDSGSVGCSPDRLIVHNNEALEVKVPTGPVMCGYLIDGIEDAYKAQLQGQILIGQFSRVHFFAYSDELPALYAVVEPDRGFLMLLNQYLVEFNQELLAGVQLIRDMGYWPIGIPSAFPALEPDEGVI